MIAFDSKKIDNFSISKDKEGNHEMGEEKHLGEISLPIGDRKRQDVTYKIRETDREERRREKRERILRERGRKTERKKNKENEREKGS